MSTLRGRCRRVPGVIAKAQASRVGKLAFSGFQFPILPTSIPNLFFYSPTLSSPILYFHSVLLFSSFFFLLLYVLCVLFRSEIWSPYLVKSSGCLKSESDRSRHEISERENSSYGDKQADTFLFVRYTLLALKKTGYSSVSIVTRLRAGRPRNWSYISGIGIRFCPI